MSSVRYLSAHCSFDNIQMENVNYYSILLSFKSSLFFFSHTRLWAKRYTHESINWVKVFVTLCVDSDHHIIYTYTLTKKHSIFRRTCSYAIIPKSFIGLIGGFGRWLHGTNRTDFSLFSVLSGFLLLLLVFLAVFSELDKIVKKCFSSVSAVFCFCHSGYEKPHLTLSKLHAHIVWSLSHISFFSLFFVCHSKWCQCQKPPTSIPVFFPLFFFSDTFYRISQKVNLAIVWLTRF